MSVDPNSTSGNNSPKTDGSEQSKSAQEPEKTTAIVPVKKSELQVKAADAMEKAQKGECNAFEAVRLMIDSMSDALEESSEYGSLPRYVRIARVGENELVEGKRPIGEAVAAVAGGFLYALGVVSEMTLKAIDLLTDIDGGVALVEVGAEMLKTLSSEKFTNSLQRSVGIKDKDLVKNPMGDIVGEATTQFEKVLKYVPSPEDVEAVSRALYRLLAIQQLDAPLKEEKVEVHVNLSGTGKARLMSWALKKPIPVFTGSGLLDFSSPINVTYIGSRIDPFSSQTPTVQLEWISEDEKRKQLIYKCNYSNIKGEIDTNEIKKILEKLNYKNEKITENLKDFQRVNELGQDGGDTEGKLDIVTLSRLLNLDSKNEQLKRAKPYAESHKE